MKEIVRLMINKYNLREYGLDFMGYRITRSRNLTYHHLINKQKNNGKSTIENGAILLKNSHFYLNVIEKENYNIFKKITKEMIIENQKGEIDLINLYNIDQLLLEFEEKYYDKYKFMVPDIYRNRFLREIDKDVLDNIDKYELKKS